jgi:integrase
MALHELSQKELEKRIKEAQAAGGIKKIADGEGLYLVHRANGGLSWQLDYTLNGIRRTFSMGTYPKVKLSTARVLAEKARELVQLGQDPVEARRTARGETKAAKTLSEVFHEWIDREKVNWKGDRHYSDYLQAANANFLASHGAKKITELTEQDCRDILQRVEDRDAAYMLTRVRTVLKRTCEYAVLKRYIAANPVAKVPRAEYRTHQEGHHPALVKPAEFRHLLLALDRERGSIPIMALRFQALTFVRPQNIRSATWHHFDLNEAVWDVPEDLTKKNRSFLVPLSRQAVTLLKNWQTVTGGSTLVFPGTNKDGMLSENTLNKNLERLGFKGRHSSHGFRASARTMLEEGGYESKVTTKQLAHQVKDKTDRAYNRAEFWDIRVEMMQAWADYMDALRTDLHLPYRWFAEWRAMRSMPEPRSATSGSPDQLSLGLEILGPK